MNTNTGSLGDEVNDLTFSGGKWEDEEERRFYEDICDLKDFVPASVLGLGNTEEADSEKVNEHGIDEKEELRKLEAEIKDLKNHASLDSKLQEEWVEIQFLFSRAHLLPRSISPPESPQVSPPESPSLQPQIQAPSQLLTTLLTRLPESTNRALIDQVAIDFAFLASKAARKRLVKVCSSSSSLLCQL